MLLDRQIDAYIVETILPQLAKRGQTVNKTAADKIRTNDQVKDQDGDTEINNLASKQIQLGRGLQANSFQLMPLRINLTQLLRSHPAVASCIVTDFDSFLGRVEEKLRETLGNEVSFDKNKQDISFWPQITSCPLPAPNFQDLEFLFAALNNPNGSMIFLREAQVLTVSQPQLYLSSWEESWMEGCPCGMADETEAINLSKEKQGLRDILRSYGMASGMANGNLSELKTNKEPRCACGVKYKRRGISKQVYQNCQRVLLRIKSISGNGVTEATRIFDDQPLEAFLDHKMVGRIAAKSIVDVCGIFIAKPIITRVQPPHIQIRQSRSLSVLTFYEPKVLSSANNPFFNSLHRLHIQQEPCRSVYETETIVWNYQQMFSAIQEIKFPYLQRNTFTTLKLVALNSLFLQRKGTKSHLLVLTDELDVLSRSLSLPQVRMRRLPSVYDSQSIQVFLSMCHHSVLLVVSPSKKDLQVINLILNGELASCIDVVLWVLAEPEQSLKKQLHFEGFDVVLDLTMEKNSRVCKDVYDELVDARLECFLPDEGDIDVDAQMRKLTSVKRAPPPRGTLSNTFNGQRTVGTPSEGLPQECLIEEQNNLARELLHRYYLKCRQYKQSKTSLVAAINNLSEGFSQMRNFLCAPSGSAHPAPSSSPKLTLLDAFLTIFIDEQTNRNKYSSTNTLFANQVSKLMLNQASCEISFWQYEPGGYVQDQDIYGAEMSEGKHYVQLPEMMARMVRKVVALTFEGQL